MTSLRPMGDVISARVVPPLGYTMKIESFSLLSKLLEKSSKDKYESNEFEVGGHKWKMILYPNGDWKNDAEGYISLYLEMTDATPSSEVNVMLKFFVLDQNSGKHIIFEDKRLMTFNAMKNVRGISQMLSLDTFRDSSNGYIIDDCCIFGTEVVVAEPERKGEKLTIIENPDNATFSWKIDKFSTLKDAKHLSNTFTIGGFKWKLALYPMGYGTGKGSVSLFLELRDYSDLKLGWKVLATYDLIMKDPVHHLHRERSVTHWYCASSVSWGYPAFISLADLKDKKRSFIVNDTVTVEVKITFMSMLNSFA